MLRSVVFVICLFCLTVGSCGTFAQGPGGSPGPVYQTDQLARGRQLLEQGDIPRARACFEAIPESSADYFHALANLAIVERIQGHLDLSVQLFEKSMDQFEVSRQQRLDQVRQQIRIVRKELAAIPIQQRTEQVQPESEPQTEQDADLHEDDPVEQLTERLNQLERRFAYYQRMPYPANYSFELGNTLFDAMTFQRALDAYAAAVKADEKFGPAYAKLSVCYFLFNNCKKAKWAYRQALQLEQTFPRQFEEDLKARCGE